MTRLVPQLPLPPYSYVTGRFPHPTRDPAGHAYGVVEGPPEPFDQAHWADCTRYLYGIDLFNFGYYWEAHEVWESLWHAAGRHGVMADFLKGLIKMAAAGVKVREGRPDGVRRHARRAIELFSSVQADPAGAAVPFFCGLNIATLIPFADQVANDPPVSRDRTAPIEVVFPFALTVALAL
jgi:hypothetical protein